MVKVNGDVITEPAIEINESADAIDYLGKVVIYTGKVYYMFNKPAGYITARKDTVNKTVFDFFHDVNMNGVFHVGRLDKDTEAIRKRNLYRKRSNINKACKNRSAQIWNV